MTDEEEEKEDFTCNMPDKSPLKAGFTCKSSKARQSRRAIKEGMIRQSTKNPLDKPASDLDVETALALAKLYDQEDITCPPQRHCEKDEPC